MRHARRRLLLASTMVMTLFAAPNAGAAPTDSTSTDLASSDDDTSFRIPAMTVTQRGTIIAAFDQRNGTTSDLPADIDTMVRRSTDNGATWDDSRAAVDYPAPQGCGDPSLLTDRETGTVHLFCTYSHGEVGFGDSEPGSADSTDPRTLHVREMTSSDEGKTWSEPRDITAQIKDPSWAGIFSSSGHGVQTSDGRLLQPIVVRTADGNHHAANIYSDDHGKTWHHGELLAKGTDESKAVELPDGRIAQNSRNVDGGNRLVSMSTDDGKTFGSPDKVEDLPDPGVNADEIRAGDDRLLFSNPASTSDRVNLTVRLSCDNGKSWSDGTVVRSSQAGYSTMAMLPNGRVGVLAEHGPTGPGGTITFTSLDPDDAGECANG